MLNFVYSVYIAFIYLPFSFFFSLQNLKDNFWNFVFYKFIFIFGVMNVQTMDEVICWVAWFTVLGFFNLHTQLCKDRFEYVSILNSVHTFCIIFFLSAYTMVNQKFCNILLMLGTIQHLWMFYHGGEGDTPHETERCWTSLILSEYYSLDLLL